MLADAVQSTQLCWCVPLEATITCMQSVINVLTQNIQTTTQSSLREHNAHRSTQVHHNGTMQSPLAEGGCSCLQHTFICTASLQSGQHTCLLSSRGQTSSTCFLGSALLQHCINNCIIRILLPCLAAKPHDHLRTALINVVLFFWTWAPSTRQTTFFAHQPAGR